MQRCSENLAYMFTKSHALKKEIQQQLEGLKYA
jgi:hypothetical protein